MTAQPTGPWVEQQARNLLMTLDEQEQRPRFLIRDRDRKFTYAFDEVFRSESVRVIRAPVAAPRTRAHAERWVGSVRRECLDRLLIISRKHLERVLREYVEHYNTHRPHRALEQRRRSRSRRHRDRATTTSCGYGAATGSAACSTSTSSPRSPADSHALRRALARDPR